MIDKAIRDMTDYQRRIMLVLCDAAEKSDGDYITWTRAHSVRLRVDGSVTPCIRETTAGRALVRKGLATQFPDGKFAVTTEGYWLGDGLRILDRMGMIGERQ